MRNEQKSSLEPDVQRSRSEFRIRAVQSRYEYGLTREALRETKGWVEPSVGSVGRGARKEPLTLRTNRGALWRRSPNPN